MAMASIKMAKRISLSDATYRNSSTRMSFEVTSYMLISAKTPIFSCAIMDALYGMLIRLTMNVATEHWNTQLAATMRPAGMFILQLRNHTPAVSITIRIMIAMSMWM